MNRLTRMLTMAGLGLVTGVTLGAGPAMAATSDAQSSAQPAAASPGWGNDRVVGYFPSWFSCERAGDYGDDAGWWDDYRCVRVHSGFHGRYALVVEYDNWGHGWNGHWPNHWNGGGNGWGNHNGNHKGNHKGNHMGNHKWNHNKFNNGNPFSPSVTS